VDIANIIIALVVPFVSVVVAQQMTQRSAKRATMMHVFLKTNRDLVSFRWAANEYRYFRELAVTVHTPESQKAVADAGDKLHTTGLELVDDVFAVELLLGKHEIGKQLSDILEHSKDLHITKSEALVNTHLELLAKMERPKISMKAQWDSGVDGLDG
jgi:glutathionylspermidine synthase